jgi:RecA/RadA recombinase
MAVKKKQLDKKKFNITMLAEGMAKAGFKMDLLSDKGFGDPEEWINLGCYVLNAQTSGSIFGGIPSNRITEFAGDPGTGKTFLCLNLAREAQKMGYDVIYIDTEGALEKKQLENFEIDPAMFIKVDDLDTVASVSNYMVNLLEQTEKIIEQGYDPKFIIFIDSIGMLSTEKEQTDTQKGHDASDMGLQAKQLKKLFRLVTRRLSNCKIPLVFTNHVYAGGMYESKKASGGQGHIFAASTILFFSKSHMKEDKDKTGIIGHSTPHKTRFAIPTPVDFHINFYEGMNPYIGLEQFVSWDACGIDKGKLMLAKDFAKEKSKPARAISYELVDTNTGEVRDLVFIPSTTGRWCIKHLGKSVPSIEHLFTKEIFTMEVLQDLDNNVIKPTFEYPDQEKLRRIKEDSLADAEVEEEELEEVETE